MRWRSIPPARSTTRCSKRPSLSPSAWLRSRRGKPARRRHRAPRSTPISPSAFKPLWSDDQPRDVLSRDGEVPLQVSGAAGEVAGQAAGDEVAIGAECFGGPDFSRVGVPRGRAGLPGADLGSSVVFFAFVDDGGVSGEEADDRVDVAIGVAFKVARDDVWNLGGHASSSTDNGRATLSFSVSRLHRVQGCSLRYCCTNAIAMLPSPTAAATRFTGLNRTSPTANTPGTLVSSRYGSRSASPHRAAALTSVPVRT